jgi:hypothetical protein
LSNPDNPRQQTLAELLEWRARLPGWEWRPAWDYLEELRRLCEWGRIEVYGHQVDELWRRPISDEPDRVPRSAFFDYRLDQQLGGQHGQLSDHLSSPKWQNLRFFGDTPATWQAALESGELNAPKLAIASATSASSPTPVATANTAPPPASNATNSSTPAPRPPPIRGRRRGSGAIDDSGLLDRMLGLLVAGSAVSVNDAASKVAAGAKGTSETAIRGRLWRKFKAVLGLQPPPGKTWCDVQHEFHTKRRSNF